MKNVCEEIRSLFDPYLNGGLSKEDRERMDGHFETCDACRSELALERRIIDALETLPEIPCPERVVRRIEDKTLGRSEKAGVLQRRLERRTSFYWRTASVGLAAAAVVVLLLVRPFGGEDISVPQEYTEMDAQKARNEAEWSLAYIAKTMNQTERKVLEDVLLNDLPSTVRKSLESTIPIFKGGQ